MISATIDQSLHIDIQRVTARCKSICNEILGPKGNPDRVPRSLSGSRFVGTRS